MYLAVPPCGIRFPFSGTVGQFSLFKVKVTWVANFHWIYASVLTRTRFKRMLWSKQWLSSPQPHSSYTLTPLPLTARETTAIHGSLFTYDSSLALGDESRFGLVTACYNIRLSDEIII
jgi:hypothetical protein